MRAATAHMHVWPRTKWTAFIERHRALHIALHIACGTWNPWRALQNAGIALLLLSVITTSYSYDSYFVVRLNSKLLVTTAILLHAIAPAATVGVSATS